MPLDLSAWEIFKSCAAGLFTAMAVFGTGRLFLRRYPGEIAERAVVSFGLGFAILQPAAVALTLMGFLSSFGAGALLLPGFFIALNSLGRTAFPALRLALLDALLLGLALVLILAGLLVSLAPVLNHDALTAHAYLPDLWVATRSMALTPWSFATHNMQGGHVILALTRALGPIEALKFFHGLSAVMGLVGVFALGKIYGGERAGLVALLLAATMFTTVFLFHNLQLDFFVATLTTAFFLVLLRVLRGENHWYSAAAIFGGAAAIKYPALSLLPLAAAAVTWCRGWRRAFYFSWLSVLSSVFFMSPWLARNYLAKKNALFPFFENGAEFWSITAGPPTTANHFIAAAQNLLGIGLTPQIIGLLFIALVPGLFLGFRKLAQPEKALGTLCLLGLAFWSLFSRAPWQLTRFYLPGFWLLGVVAARGLASRRWSMVVAICVIVTNGLIAWVQITSATGSLPVALGIHSRASQILTFDPGLPVRQAARDSKVFSLGVYAYGLGADAVAPFIYDGSVAAPYFSGAGTSEEIARRLRTAGFTHVIVDFGHLYALQTGGFPFLATDAFAEALRTWRVAKETIVPGPSPGTMRGAVLLEIPAAPEPPNRN